MITLKNSIFSTILRIQHLTNCLGYSHFILKKSIKTSIVFRICYTKVELSVVIKVLQYQLLCNNNDGNEKVTRGASNGVSRNHPIHQLSLISSSLFAEARICTIINVYLFSELVSSSSLNCVTFGWHLASIIDSICNISTFYCLNSDKLFMINMFNSCKMEVPILNPRF